MNGGESDGQPNAYLASIVTRPDAVMDHGLSGVSIGAGGVSVPVADRRTNGLELPAFVMMATTATLLLGMLPMLFGELASRGLMSLQNMGLAFTLETLAMGLTSALVGLFFKPTKLRLTAALALVLCAFFNMVLTYTSGQWTLLVCTLLGVPEGVLLWIGLGGIVARAPSPARWTAIWALITTFAQLMIAGALSIVILPKLGITAGFGFVSFFFLASIVGIFFIPDSLGNLAKADQPSGGLPTVRGCFALLAALMFSGAGGALIVYMVPLAQTLEIGLENGRYAIAARLAGQIVGSALAILLTVRLGFFRVLQLGSAILLATIGVFAASHDARLFIAASVVLGCVHTFVSPFILPMLIDSDPSRRAAAQFGSASLLGGASGPFLASMAVAHGDARAALAVGGGLLLLMLMIVSVLRLLSAQRIRSRACAG